MEIAALPLPIAPSPGLLSNPADAPEFKSLLSATTQDQTAAGIRIKHVALDFESMFLGQMLEPMFAGVKSQAPFGGGFAEDTWRSLLVQEYGKAMARNGGIGIAKMVEKQMRSLAGLEPDPGAKKKVEVKA